MTVNLYRTLISLFFIALFCWIPSTLATEISPILGFGQENFTFDLNDINDNDKDIKFEPNIAGVVRLGINAFGFGVSYSLRGSSKDIDPAKGTTTFTDFQLGYQSKNWGVDGYYQNYTGFYTKNTEQIQLFPDLTFKHYGILGRLALNDSDFTISGVVDQSEHIRSSSYKYYLVTGFSQHSMDTNISLLQQENVGLNPELESLRKMEASSLKLGLGAGRIWYFSNKLFVSGLLDLVPNYTFYKYTTSNDQTSNRDNLSLSYNIKLGFGYSGSKYKFGLSFNNDSTVLKTNSRGHFAAAANRFLLYARAYYDF